MDRLEKRILNRLEGIHNHINLCCVELAKYEAPDASFGTFLAQGHLARLSSSFGCALSLIKQGYSLESVAIFRLIFEQLAYATTITGLSESQLRRVSVTKSIGSLSRINKRYPQIYGILSTYAHFDYLGLIESMDFDQKEEDIVLVSVRDYRLSLESDSISALAMFLLLAQVFFSVSLHFAKGVDGFPSECISTIFKREGRAYSLMRKIIKDEKEQRKAS